MSSNAAISDSDKGRNSSSTYLPPLKNSVKQAEKNPPPSFNPKEEIMLTRKSKKKKKRTEEQIERDQFVEELLDRHSHVIHVDSKEYMKKKWFNYKPPALSTDPNQKEKQKKIKERKEKERLEKELKEKSKNENPEDDESKVVDSPSKSKSQPVGKLIK